jgi:hypothetical protein
MKDVQLFSITKVTDDEIGGAGSIDFSIQRATIQDYLMVHGDKGMNEIERVTLSALRAIRINLTQPTKAQP